MREKVRLQPQFLFARTRAGGHDVRQFGIQDGCVLENPIGHQPYIMPPASGGGASAANGESWLGSKARVYQPSPPRLSGRRRADVRRRRVNGRYFQQV
jgi:hypothetical protein